ncbi:hypothetical protein Pelo_5910 [Pelomyxa schiedti]|nr:hypothetical protein Pelo_5910 [Pelomyxa schiedti]
MSRLSHKPHAKQDDPDSPEATASLSLSPSPTSTSTSSPHNTKKPKKSKARKNPDSNFFQANSATVTFLKNGTHNVFDGSLAATFKSDPRLFSKLEELATTVLQEADEEKWLAVAQRLAVDAKNSDPASATEQPPIEKTLYAIFEQKANAAFGKNIFLESISVLREAKPRLARIILALAYILKYEKPQVEDIEAPSTTTSSISSSPVPIISPIDTPVAYPVPQPNLHSNLFDITWNESDCTSDSYYAHKLKLETIQNLSSANWPSPDRLAKEKLEANTGPFEVIKEDTSKVLTRLAATLNWAIITKRLKTFDQAALLEVKSLEGAPCLYHLKCSQECDRLQDIYLCLKEVNPNLRVVLSGVAPNTLNEIGMPASCTLDMSLDSQTVLDTLFYIFGETSLFFGGCHQNQEIGKLAPKLAEQKELLKKFLEIVCSDHEAMKFKSISDCLRRSYDWLFNSYYTKMPQIKKDFTRCLDIVWSAPRYLERSPNFTIKSILIPRNTEDYSKIMQLGGTLHTAGVLRVTPVKNGALVTPPSAWAMDVLSTRHHTLRWFTPSLKEICQLRPSVGGVVLERGLFHEVATGPTAFLSFINGQSQYRLSPLQNRASYLKFNDAAKAKCDILRGQGIVGVAGDESTGKTCKIDLCFSLERIGVDGSLPSNITCNVQASAEREGNALKCLEFFILMTLLNFASKIVFLCLYPFELTEDLRNFLRGIQQCKPNCLVGKDFDEAVFREFFIVSGAEAISLMKQIPDLWACPSGNVGTWQQPTEEDDEKFAKLQDLLHGKERFMLNSHQELIMNNEKLFKHFLNAEVSAEGAQFLCMEAGTHSLQLLKQTIKKNFIPPGNHLLQGALDLLPDKDEVRQGLSNLTSPYAVEFRLKELTHKFTPGYWEQYCDQEPAASDAANANPATVPLKKNRVDTTRKRPHPPNGT